MPTSCVRETCHFEVTSAAAAAAAVAVVVGFVFVLHHDVVRSDSVFYRNEHGLIILEWFQTCSVSCEACIDLTKSVVTTIKTHNHIPVYIVTSTSNTNLNAFIEHTELDTSKVEILNINNKKVFRELVDFAYPHGYIIQNNEVTDHRVGLQCNMNFLDKIIR